MSYLRNAQKAFAAYSRLTPVLSNTGHVKLDMKFTAMFYKLQEICAKLDRSGYRYEPQEWEYIDPEFLEEVNANDDEDD